jgi:hypothetical protein
VLTAVRFTFGVVATASESDRRVVLSDFCAALSEQVGARIDPHLSPSAHALASAARAGRVHLAYLPPLAIAQSKMTGGAAPVAVAARAVLVAGPTGGNVVVGWRVPPSIRVRVLHALVTLASCSSTRELVTGLFGADRFEPATSSNVHALASLRIA